MAGLFDQMEKAGIAAPRPLQEPIASGFVTARLDDDPPIFSKQRINFDPPDPVVHMAVCKNQLVMGMSTNILLRIDLDKPNTPNEVELPKTADDTISGMFLDPTGRHLIVSMSSNDSYYISRNSLKPKLLTKLKGHKVTAVGWNQHNVSESSTDTIMLGTSKGLILECMISVSEDSRLISASFEQHIKQLYSVARDKTASAVTAIEFDRISTSSTATEYFIMISVGSRLFQFIGSVPASAEMPVFQHVFSRYSEKPEHFVELPGSIAQSQLRLFHPRPQSPPKYFAWMTGAGVYCGRIDLSGAAGPHSVTTDTKLIQYPRDSDEKVENPLSIVLTEFHILVLFSDRLKAICFLNEQHVYTDVFADRFGSLLGVCRDPFKETVWAFACKAVYKYKIVRESRDIWLVYLDKKDFTMAKTYCQDNKVYLDKVLVKEAEHLFEKKKYMESAKVYAESQTSFEEITLKFIALDDKEPLKQFLLNKMATLKPQEKTQITMLVVWLTEVWLNQLGQLKECGKENSEQYEQLRDSFRRFLATPRVKECIDDNKETVYDLISSHGDIEDMIFFAVLIQDFERVISHYIQRNNYSSALELLAKQTNKELFYKFSPVLMQHIPRETVNAWIAMKEKLDPRLLIPALVQYEHEKYKEQGSEAVRYLEFCIYKLGVREQAIHNYLLSLYVKLKSDSLMKYLYTQGQEEDQICYDLKYALRLCAEHGNKQACVHIYTTMGLYDEAVDLALQFDIDLAKQNADKPEDNEDLKRKLWLKIARHVVEKEKDIKRAMEFLQECRLLKIEDILPFFPDFVTIDNFKDAICESLQEYNRDIEILKTEMEEATESARDIRNEIYSFRNKYSVVNASDKCSFCEFPLMTRTFYLFPCSHRFHVDCLISEVLPHLTPSKKLRVTELQRRLAATRDLGAGIASQTATLPVADHSLKEELDELVASECVYCGDLMIRSVDKPFFENEDDIARSWL